MNKNSYLNFFIILACILVVLLPLVAGGLRDEVGNWHLAAAANALELGQGDFATSLKRAEEAGIELKSSHNYWLLEIDRIAASEPDELPTVLKQALDAGASREIMVRRALNQWARQFEKKQRERQQLDPLGPQPLSDPDRSELALRLRILELGVAEEDLEKPEVRNELAYFRALAGVDLDKALEDINFALEQEPENYAYLDTRAWVYFQKGDVDEALADADLAVAKLHEEIERAESGTLGRLLDLLPDGSPAQANKDAAESESEQVRSEDEVSVAIWTEGVLRYHRAKIHEALDNSEAAEEDWVWLREQRLPRDGSLQ